MPSPSFLDPDPDRWLSTERVAGLKSALESSCEFLALSGLLDSAVKYWVNLEIYNESCELTDPWPSSDQRTYIDYLEGEWFKKNSLSDFCISKEQLYLKLSVNPASLYWAHCKWSHRLQTLYIDRKSELDMAVCLMIRLTNKNLALELYHRIKAGEISFEQAAKEFGVGPEKLNGGRLPLQSLKSMPLGLGDFLRRLTVGELSMPLRLGNGFVLVQLERLDDAVLNEEVETRLLTDELRRWVAAVSKKAKIALMLNA